MGVASACSSCAFSADEQLAELGTRLEPVVAGWLARWLHLESTTGSAVLAASLARKLHAALADVCRMGRTAVLATALTVPPTVVLADDANDILRAMSQYLANQKNISPSMQGAMRKSRVNDEQVVSIII